MATQEIARREFTFTPTTLKEAQEYANIIANSGVCPESFKGRPNDVLIVLQLGSELGLKPMQSLRTLGVVNGMPFAYGDGLLALVKRHPAFIDMKEWTEGDIEDKSMTAYCMISRKDKEPVTQKFSVEDATRAGLWGNGKRTPWIQYPKRMLQHRARGFAIKDAFPDAVFGVRDEDEVRDIASQSKPTYVTLAGKKGIEGLEQALGVNEPETLYVEGEVIEAETYVAAVETSVSAPLPPVSDQENMIGELKALIEEKGISKRAQELWCKQFNVESIDLIPSENLIKIIDHLKTKESK